MVTKKKCWRARIQRKWDTFHYWFTCAMKTIGAHGQKCTETLNKKEAVGRLNSAAVLRLCNKGGIVNLSNWADVATILGALAVVGISIQVRLTQIQIKADHERGRREKTVDLLVEWDKRLKKESALARKIIECLTEEQCREVVAQQKLQVPKKLKSLLRQFFGEAFKVEGHSNGYIVLNEAHAAELRWHAVTYLN